MIRLDPNTQLEVVLAAAETTNLLPIDANFCDLTGPLGSAASSYVPGFFETNTYGKNAVIACPPAPAGAMREIDFLCVQNADTVSATITVQKRAVGSNLVTVLWSGAVAKGLSLQYIHGLGFT